MNTGFTTRRISIVVFIFFVSALFAKPTLYMEVKRLNDNVQVTKSYMNLFIMAHEVVGLEFIGHFGNDSRKLDYICKLRRNPSSEPFPDYIDGWKDKTFILGPEEETELTNIIYIRPSEVLKDTFVVEVASRREDISGFTANRFTIYLHVDTALFAHPVIVQESKYTQGLTNSIAWFPAEASVGQDAYYFDIEDPTNLLRSVQRLYRSSDYTQSEKMETSFHNLEDGHTYGYFIKALHYHGVDPVYLYSDIVYSTQDNTPPETITLPQAIVKANEMISVSWNTVEDQGENGSGVAWYRIYRATDTGVELLIDSLPPPLAGIDFLSYFDHIVPGPTYYYSIHAIDSAGNESDGDRSNGIWLSGSGEADELPGDGGGEGSEPPVNASHFIQGSIDTLWIIEDGRETAMRFQASRDSVKHFESPPPLLMRFFDSGWINMEDLPTDPFNPMRHYWIFDYKDDDFVDKNFVNGHTYHRRVIRQYAATNDTSWLESIVPDCFPPEDIHNLRVISVMEDGSAQDAFNGYSQWHFRIEWEGISDDVSGLKQYHIYRQIEGVDSTFQVLALADTFKQTFLRDSIPSLMPDAINNAMVNYRVIAEDYVGYTRALDETNWEAGDRALGPPVIQFFKNSPLVISQGEDSIFTKKETVTFQLFDLDKTDIKRYIVSINGNERVHPNTGQDTLVVPLPPDEIAFIKIRASYLGMRSSVWSTTKIVIRAMEIPPLNLSVSNDSDYWGGHIYLQWIRPSKDIVKYEVWRWNESGDSTLIGLSTSGKDTLRWTDYYDIDELTGEKTSPLVVFRKYTYRIRKENIFGDITNFSNRGSAFCNKPPTVVSHHIHDINGGQFAVTIYWQRSRPNLATFDFRTEIRVYQNDLSQLQLSTYVGDDDTTYIYFNALVRNNTIFTIREIPNGFDGLTSAWSAPYTVSLDTINMQIQAQPFGHIFTIWDDPEIVEKYKVTSYQFCRDDTCWSLPKETISFMDSSNYLEHGHPYLYSVFALDSLNQIVAGNARADTSDTGSVYIPEILPFQTRYFNDDSIEVEWIWRDVNKAPAANTTRGAQNLTLQASLSRTFPNNEDQTLSFTYMADATSRNRKIPIPNGVNRENEIVYFRMGANDKWNHPDDDVWSNDFYLLKKAIYDTVFPRIVKDISVPSVQAYYRGVDSVIVDVRWNGIGVERPDSTGIYWDYLIGNIAYYQVERKREGHNDWILIGTVPVQNNPNDYVFRDTTRNQVYFWRTIAVDSAFNTKIGLSVKASGLVETPKPPLPSDFKSCNIQAVQADSYFVEISMDPGHFYLAYEIDEGLLLDQLLCRSGWIEGPDFSCTSGWGAIKLDTTWLRVKAKLGESHWESGWSEIIFFTDADDFGKDDSQVDTYSEIPKTFDVKPCYPNPFNAETVIAYQLPKPGFVKIYIYNVKGALVRTLVREDKEAGYFSTIWDGKNDKGIDAASGMYVSHVVVKTVNGLSHEKRQKMTVIK